VLFADQATISKLNNQTDCASNAGQDTTPLVNQTQLDKQIPNVRDLVQQIEYRSVRLSFLLPISNGRPPRRPPF